MTDSIVGLLVRVFMWGAAAVFAVSLLIVGSFAALLGGVWMLLTGRNPLRVYRAFPGFAHRMPGGGFQWGTPAPAAEAAAHPAGAPARPQSRFGRGKSEAEDVVVKEIR